MSMEIKILDIGDIELDSSFLVLARDPGRIARVPTLSYLITGGSDLLLVDTGYRNIEIMERLGMRGIQTREQVLDNALARHGVKMSDIRYILHTHLHIDHAGKDDLFPNTTTVAVNRRELEYAVSGLMGAQYPPEDVKHLIDRLHTRNALRLLDLEGSGGEEIIPGVVCVAAGAHTEGSMNILVETAQGTACICGDVVYDVYDQIVEPLHQINEMEPATTGNHGTTKRAEKAAIKQALNSGSFLLPMHDLPAVIDRGRVIGRLHETVPGPMAPVKKENRNWFPA